MSTLHDEERERIVAKELHNYAAWLLNNLNAEPLERRSEKSRRAKNVVSEILSTYKKELREEANAEIRSYAHRMRSEVDSGVYCKNESSDWKNGYDCAMYDIVQRVSPITPNE